VAKKVLVVEDEPDTNFILMQMLEVSGFQTASAFDGAQALKMVNTDRPDAILLDIMMPQMDGWEVCRRIKGEQTTSDIGIIFVTAYGGDDLQTRADEVRADLVLTKPVGIGQVVGAVSEVLGKYGGLV
jgi:CheY-like chemotaxis protein